MLQPVVVVMLLIPPPLSDPSSFIKSNNNRIPCEMSSSIKITGEIFVCCVMVNSSETDNIISMGGQYRFIIHAAAAARSEHS